MCLPCVFQKFLFHPGLQSHVTVLDVLLWAAKPSDVFRATEHVLDGEKDDQKKRNPNSQQQTEQVFNGFMLAKRFFLHKKEKNGSVRIEIK